MHEDPRPIYLDHHATTPLDPRVRDAMLPWLGARFGNPGSRTHVYGREAAAAVEAARAEVAALIGAKPREIVFTSGATESDHLAITGVVGGTKLGSPRVVSQITEHSAVLRTLDALEREGRVVTDRLPVDAEGHIAIGALEAALTPETALVSVMLASSEIGTVQPIEAIATLGRSRGLPVHCDAAQGLGLLPLDVSKTPLDLVSMSSHKMYGPMGVGALYVRDRHDLRVVPSVVGGGQERGLRGGTLNVAGIVGFGRACTIMREEGEAEAARLGALRDALRDGLLERLPGTHLHGAWDTRHPGNLALRFDDVRADTLIVETSATLAFSSGSACASGSDAPSHVLLAIGLSDADARNGVRIGLGRSTTREDVDRTLETLVSAVRLIRERSPLARARAR